MSHLSNFYEIAVAPDLRVPCFVVEDIPTGPMWVRNYSSENYEGEPIDYAELEADYLIRIVAKSADEA